MDRSKPNFGVLSWQLPGRPTGCDVFKGQIPLYKCNAAYLRLHVSSWFSNADNCLHLIILDVVVTGSLLLDG